MNTQKSFKSAVLDKASEKLDPEALCDREQQRKLVRKVVEELEPHYRWMIEQKYFKGCDIEDIAEALGRKANSVAVTLYTLRKGMKAALIKANAPKA